MTITILGSGTGVPSLRRSSCSTLVEAQGKTIVFDMGAGTLRRLLENGTGVSDISHVVLTHFHPDHCAELVPFLFALKAPETGREEKQVTLIGGQGLKQLYDGLRNVFGSWIEPGPDRLKIIELSVEKQDSLNLGDLFLRSIPVCHNPESLAYRLESGNRVFACSGDTDSCDNLVRIAEDADLFLCECSTPDEDKREKHLTPSLAGQTAGDARVKKLVLTHFYPDCDKTDIAKQCRRTYDGNVFQAEDLMKFYL